MIKLCANCQEEIYVKPCRNRPYNYCSAKCQMKHQYANGRPISVAAANDSVRLNGFPQKRGKTIPHLHNAQTYAKISKAKTGVRVPNLQGENHWNWRGGVDKGIWHSWEYKQWRKAVFERDNYTCVNCGDDSGGNLEADHIKPRFLYPELIFDITNGRTLCHDCHVKTPTYGGKVKSVVL